MRRALVFYVLACMCFVLGSTVFLTSCTLPDPKTVAELTELKSRTQILGNELADALEFVNETKSEIMSVIEKGKTGQLTAEEVTKLLGELYARYDEGQKHVSATKDALTETQQQIKALQESGVPWWQIALWMILGGANVLTGKSYLGAKKQSGEDRGVADYAIMGIDLLTRTIENVYAKGGTVKDVKLKLKDARHELIESSVSKLPIVPGAVPPPKEELPPPKI